MMHDPGTFLEEQPRQKRKRSFHFHAKK